MYSKNRRVTGSTSTEIYWKFNIIFETDHGDRMSSRTRNCTLYIFIKRLMICLKNIHIGKLGLHGGVVASTVTSQQEGRGFYSRCGRSSCVEHVLPVAAWVPSGFSGFLPQSKDMQSGSLMSKLPIGVNVRVSGCLSLCAPWMDWRPVQGVPCLRPMSAPSPRDPNEDKRY